MRSTNIILLFRSHTPQRKYVKCTMDRRVELGWMRKNLRVSGHTTSATGGHRQLISRSVRVSDGSTNRMPPLRCVVPGVGPSSCMLRPNIVSSHHGIGAVALHTLQVVPDFNGCIDVCRTTSVRAIRRKERDHAQQLSQISAQGIKP